MSLSFRGFLADLLLSTGVIAAVGLVTGTCYSFLEILRSM